MLTKPCDEIDFKSIVIKQKKWKTIRLKTTNQNINGLRAKSLKSSPWQYPLKPENNARFLVL